MKPAAPKLLDARDLPGLTDLAQEVFPEHGKVETPHHRGPIIGQIDPVVRSHGKQILKERVFGALLTRSRRDLLESDGARNDFGLLNPEKGVVAVVGAFTAIGALASCIRI